MLKRSHRDIDLPSLVPPQFVAASDVRKKSFDHRQQQVQASAPKGALSSSSVSSSAATAVKASEIPADGPSPRRGSQAWDSALLSAYMEADVSSGHTAGLGMGLEIVSRVKEPPKWEGSWSAHHDYMVFIYGEESAPLGKASGPPPLPPPCNSSETATTAAPVASGAASTATNEGENPQDEEEVPTKPKRRRYIVEEDDDAPPYVREGARNFAERTLLRRGFFASALKRRLEALRDENRSLKRLAVEVLDEREREELKVDFGEEADQQCVVVGKPVANPDSSSSDDDRAALTRVVERAASSTDDVTRRDLALVSVVQQAQRAFVVTNPALPDNPIVWSSDEFTTLTGYERSEVCGRNCRFLQGPKTNPKAVDAVRQAINDSHEASVVLLNYRKDGSTFWNRFFIAPLRDSKGNVTFYVGVQTDVTRSVKPHN